MHRATPHLHLLTFVNNIDGQGLGRSIPLRGIHRLQLALHFQQAMYLQALSLQLWTWLNLENERLTVYEDVREAV